MTYRRYSRIAAVVFLLFTAYPVVTKLTDGKLAHDWLHSTLHLASALVFHLGLGVFALAVIGANAGRRPAALPTA